MTSTDGPFWTGQQQSDTEPMVTTSSEALPAAAATPAASTPHIIPPDDEEGKNPKDTSPKHNKQVQIVDATPPISSIEKKNSGVSSTDSSLSDGIDNRGSSSGRRDGGTTNHPPSSVNANESHTACGTSTIGTGSITSRPATKAADKQIQKAAAAMGRKAIKGIMKKRPASNRSKDSLGGGSSSQGTDASASIPSSRTPSIGWGWFEHNNSSLGNLNEATGGNAAGASKKKKKRGTLLDGFASSILGDTVEVPVESEPTSIAVTAPQYILEESIDNQKLWKQTAGKRPPQPAEERAYFEKLWSQNFVRSQVQYEMPVEVLTATSPISLSPFGESSGSDDMYGSHFTPYVNDENNRGTPEVKAAEVEAAEATLMKMSGTAGASQFYSHTRTNDAKSLGPHQYHHTPVNKPVRGAGDGSRVVVKGDNVFGTTVSKSFPNSRGGVDTISVSIASYRVVESRKEGRHAQFLVVYRDGSFRETIGVWKRFRDFEQLANIVSFGHEQCNVQNCATALAPLHVIQEDDHEVEPLPNAITSWKLLKKRQRWFRCLDAGYLSLKVFLLERFLHDILFESSTPSLLRNFVGVNMHTPAASQGSSLALH